MKIRVLIGAWLLAMASGAAYALGLGEILVKSRLNQPLEAEIIVREAVPGEAERLVAKLASQEDFARVGLERSRMPVLLRFDTTKNDRGQTIIKVTSDEPIREPFLTLLVEANWSGGRLLREYGVLLDPAVTAPASTIARTTPPPVAPPQPAAEPAQPPAPPVQRSAAVAEPKQPSPAAPAPARAPQPASPPPRSTALPPGFAPPPVQQRPTAPPPVDAQPASPRDGRYTVERGDTLFDIASGFAADAGVTTNQMMLALHRDNPDAFFADNINALKAGAVLRVPDVENVRSLSSTEATAEVGRQHQSWSARAPALADAGVAPSSRTSVASSAPADARLELVPPSADAAGGDAAGRAGTEEGGADVAETRAELQRTREELRSRDQEVAELASRVRDLEELNAKNARLLELKNAEVAELQRRLDDAGAPVDSAAVAAADAASDVAPADDASAASDTAAESDAVADAGATPDAGLDTDTISAMGTETPDSADGLAEASPSEPAAEEASAANPDQQSETEWAAAAAGGENDPFADAETAAAADNWAPAEPETEAPAQTPPAGTSTPPASATSTVTTSAAAPATEAQPWYMQPMVQGAGLIGLALILLLVLLARRQRSKASSDETAATPRRSVADLFSDTPAAAAVAPGGAAVAAISENEEAMDLQRQITSDPDDFGAYLELLSLYYAEGDRDSFETWAERFHERQGSTASIEWDQVRNMGEELLPEHPLFADGRDMADESLARDTVGQAAAWASTSAGAAAYAASEPDNRPDAGPPTSASDDDESRNETPATPETPRVMDISGTEFTLDETSGAVDDEDAQPIEFSLDDLDVSPTSASAAPAPLESSEHPLADTLPPLSFDDEPVVQEAGSDTHPGAASDDDGLDDVATKLELARAYLDMGDPEGARAMLEEVLGEGDTSQRDEARKMLAVL